MKRAAGDWLHVVVSVEGFEARGRLSLRRADVDPPGCWVEDDAASCRRAGELAAIGARLISWVRVCLAAEAMRREGAGDGEAAGGGAAAVSGSDDID